MKSFGFFFNILSIHFMISTERVFSNQIDLHNDELVNKKCVHLFIILA